MICRSCRSMIGSVILTITFQSIISAYLSIFSSSMYSLLRSLAFSQNKSRIPILDSTLSPPRRRPHLLSNHTTQYPLLLNCPGTCQSSLLCQFGVNTRLCRSLPYLFFPSCYWIIVVYLHVLSISDPEACGPRSDTHQVYLSCLEVYIQRCYIHHCFLVQQRSALPLKILLAHIS